MRVLPLALAAALVAATPAAAREQSFRLEIPEGKESSQRIEVPVDRPGEIEVTAEWEGGRTLRLWIEDRNGDDLARWGGTSPGRLSFPVADALVDPSRPLVVRIRTVGRRGKVEGWITVRYPSLSDGPDPAPAPSPPGTEPPDEPRKDGLASRWRDRPDAGTRWPGALERLARRIEPAGPDIPPSADAARIRALLDAAAGAARAYVELGPVSPRSADDEEPTSDEWERIWTKEDLGREVSGLVRLSDDSGLPDEAARDLRRLLANISELVRRRDEGGERAQGADEALTALAAALGESIGAPAEPPDDTGDSD